MVSWDVTIFEIVLLLVGAVAPIWVTTIVGCIAGGLTRFLPGSGGFWLGAGIGLFAGLGSFVMMILIVRAYYWGSGGWGNIFVPWLAAIAFGSVSVSLIWWWLNHEGKRKQKA